METVDSMMGDDVGTKMNNEEMLQREVTEEEAKADIEETLAIKLPEFFYFPEEISFDAFVIDSEAKMAFLQYLSDEEIIALAVYANDKEASAFALSDSGEMLGNIKSQLFDAVQSTLWKIQENGDEMPTYILQWNYKNVYYELTGKVSEEEMRKIAENIIY